MIDQSDLKYYEKLLKYELALMDAEDDLVTFAEVTMPLKKFPDDPSKSKYKAAKHHHVMGDIMMEVERGDRMKVILNLPPRHGKSELCTKRMCAWYSARHPELDVIVATYNGDFAKDFGKEVREIVNSRRFKQIFPEYHLVRGGEGSEHLITNEGGNLFFLGRRSATTGRGAHLILVDDPTKDDRDVKHDTFRDDCWEWFTQTLLTRRHHDRCPIVLTQTRWHEDDLVGRITDSSNPKFAQAFSDGFEMVNLPALALEEDPIGRKPGEPLWPERFGLQYLLEMQAANSVSFSSLYQCDPTPESGVFYQVDELSTYKRGDLPDNLTIYAASDHAVGTKNHNDPTCMGTYGVCEKGNAYILPNLVWRRIDTKTAVDEMIKIMKDSKPLFWYAEKGHISKSIGPFLKTAMMEAGVYCPVIEDHPVGDKLQRAQSARGRAAQGKILFPADAPWWPKAKAELLKFPNARHDDFVDFVSIIGMKLTSQINPNMRKKKTGFEPGTFGHMLRDFKRQDRVEETAKSRRGW